MHGSCGKGFIPSRCSSFANLRCHCSPDYRSPYSAFLSKHTLSWFFASAALQRVAVFMASSLRIICVLDPTGFPESNLSTISFSYSGISMKTSSSNSLFRYAETTSIWCIVNPSSAAIALNRRIEVD